MPRKTYSKNELSDHHLAFLTNIKRRREDLGWSQSLVAKMVNITQPRYSSIENGFQDVGLVVACKICEALNLDAYEAFMPREIQFEIARRIAKSKNPISGENSF